MVLSREVKRRIHAERVLEGLNYFPFLRISGTRRRSRSRRRTTECFPSKTVNEWLVLLQALKQFTAQRREWKRIKRRKRSQKQGQWWNSAVCNKIWVNVDNRRSTSTTSSSSGSRTLCIELDTYRISSKRGKRIRRTAPQPGGWRKLFLFPLQL